MVRINKDSSRRYSKDHYSAPIVTISVDEKQQNIDREQRGYPREGYRDKYSHQSVTQVNSTSTINDDDFNEYDYEIIDGRGNNAPRIDFGNNHLQHHQQQHLQHRPGKYENCFKTVDSDFDDDDEDEEENDEQREEPMPLPDIRATSKPNNISRSTGSFRTALNNHPLVKQQQERQHTSNGNARAYEKLRPTMGTKIHPQSNQQDEYSRAQGYGRKVTTANYRHRRQSFDEEGMREREHYGRGYEHEDEEFSGRKTSNQVRLEDVQPYLEEIDGIDVEEMPKQKPAKTIQINASSGAPTSKHQQAEKPRQWEPLHHHPQQQQQQQPPQSQPSKSLQQQPQKSQHQKELEEIQQKIQQRRQFAAAKELEDERLYDLEMARPTHSSKVRSVVNLLNKEPSKGKDSLRSVMSIPEDKTHYRSAGSIKVPPPSSKAIPPPPPPPQNLLIKAGSITPTRLQKPIPVSLATDEVKNFDTLPPPPPQLHYRKPESSIPAEPLQNSTPMGGRSSPKSGADILSDEADLLLQYFKSNWQVVDYLNLKIPNEVVDRMNRLPRKIILIKEVSEFTKLKKLRRPAKRLRGRKMAKGTTASGLQRRVIERVASMKSEEISRIVSGSSSLSRQETEREGEIYDSRIETKIYAKSERHNSSGGREDLLPHPQIRQSLTESEEPVYEDSKWNLIKKGGRFVKKSAAALITSKKQSPCPTPVQFAKPQPQAREIPPPMMMNNSNVMQQEGLRTESRIAAEIKNLKEREEELRRNRAAMGLPNVHDLIGNWRNQDSRMLPLRETRSFNHLKINVNDQDGQRNWPPLQGNGHYGMAKSESFHQLHHHHHQQQHQMQHPIPPPPHSIQSGGGGGIAPKYLRRGTYDINASVNSNTTIWTPVEKNYRRRSVAATLINRRIHSSARAPLPIYHQQQQLPITIPTQSSVHNPSIIQQSTHNFNRNTPLMKSGSRQLTRLLFVSKRKPKSKSGRMGL